MSHLHRSLRLGGRAPLRRMRRPDVPRVRGDRRRGVVSRLLEASPVAGSNEMSARAIWKGVIRFGDVGCPVKLYSAVQDRAVHFRLLHEADHVPVEQRMVNSATGEEVPRDRVRKGFDLGDGRFVMLEDEELATLEPEESRDVEITRFVKRGTIRHPWYDRPYWLGPDGDDGAYFGLARALGRQEKEGVARWTMRKKGYLGALVPEDDRLMLITLRSVDEVILAAELEAPGGRPLAKAELDMAEQLVEALAADFDPTEYANEYRARVLELVRAKERGETIEVEAYEPERPEAPLANVLRQSLERARRKSA